MEGFLKTVSPYFPKGSKGEEVNDFEPDTPPGLSGLPTSITKLPASQTTKTLKFGEIDATKVPPIFSVTSHGKLAALLNGKPGGNSLGKTGIDQKKDSKNSSDPFSGK